MALRIENVVWGWESAQGGRGHQPVLRMVVEGVPTWLWADEHQQRWWFRGYGLVYLHGLESVLPVIELPPYHNPANGALVFNGSTLRGHTDDQAVLWYAREFFDVVVTPDEQGRPNYRAGPPFSHPPGYPHP